MVLLCYTVGGVSTSSLACRQFLFTSFYGSAKTLSTSPNVRKRNEFSPSMQCSELQSDLFVKLSVAAVRAANGCTNTNFDYFDIFYSYKYCVLGLFHDIRCKGCFRVAFTRYLSIFNFTGPTSAQIYQNKDNPNIIQIFT